MWGITGRDWHDHTGSVAGSRKRDTEGLWVERLTVTAASKQRKSCYVLRARMWCFECEHEQNSTVILCVCVCVWSEVTVQDMSITPPWACTAKIVSLCLSRERGMCWLENARLTPRANWTGELVHWLKTEVQKVNISVCVYTSGTGSWVLQYTKEWMLTESGAEWHHKLVTLAHAW